MGGVLYVAPLAKNVPPLAAVYHWYDPPGAVAVSEAEELMQTVAPAAVGAFGVVVAAMVTLLVTGGQPLVLSVTVML